MVNARLVILLLLLGLHGLTGCRPQTGNNDNAKLDRSPSQEDTVYSHHSAEIDTFDYSVCVRGAAEPVVKKDIYPDAVFRLDDNRHTGNETLPFGNGDTLTIRNWGCEYYVLTFKFKTSRFQGDTTNILFWLRNVHTLLDEVKAGIDSPYVQDGITGLNEFLNSNPKKSLMLGDEIVFNDSEIRFYATLDRIWMIDDTKYGIEISFLMGPL